MPFKSKAQQRYMFSQHPRIAERWVDHTPDMKDLPEKLSTPKTAGFWGVLIKLGAVDPYLVERMAGVAKRMGVDPPSRKELERMFPKGWEAGSQGSWQTQFEKSDWLRDANSAKMHAKDVAAGRARPSSGGWTHGPGWKSQSVPVASRVARGIMRFPGTYGTAGLLSLIALDPGTREVRRKARKGLSSKEMGEVVKKTTGRGVRIGAIGGGILGMGIPLLANLPQMRSVGGLRNLLRTSPGLASGLIGSGLITGLYSAPWGATAGGLIGSRFMPGAAEKVRERHKAAAEEETSIPPKYLTKKFTIPSGIFGGVTGGIEPPLQIALERLRKARAAGHTPSVGSLFKKMPPDLKKQMLKGSLGGAIGGLATGYLTGRLADALIQKKLKEKSV